MRCSKVEGINMLVSWAMYFDSENNRNQISVDRQVMGEMEKILKIYDRLDVYPYELYTLMSSIAVDKRVLYNLNVHNRMLNKVLDERAESNKDYVN